MVKDNQALELLKDAQYIHARVGAGYNIETREAYEEAAELLKSVKGKQKTLEARRVFLKAPMLEAGRRIDEWFKQPLSFLSEVEQHVKKAMLGFRSKEEQRARELQRIADEALAAEQRRLARLALEANMKADVEAQALERKARAEKDRLEQERLRVEAEARIKRASEAGRQLDEQADGMRAPVIKAEQPKIQGQQIRRVWRWAVTDFEKVPDEFKALNDTAVREHVNSRGFILADGMRRELEPEAVPGLRFYQQEIIASEGK